MKKIFAVTLALVMALSLAACSGKDDPKPSVSGDKEPSASQQEPATTPDPGASQTDQKDNKQPPANTYDWPVADYIAEGMKWTGGGDIVFTKQEDDYYDGAPATWIYLDEVTIDEVAAYVDTLKTNGFEFVPFFPGDAEPAIEVNERGLGGWVGAIPGECYIDITYLEDGASTFEWVGNDMVEFPYQLKIAITNRTVESGRIAM